MRNRTTTIIIIRSIVWSNLVCGFCLNLIERIYLVRAAETRDVCARTAVQNRAGDYNELYIQVDSRIHIVTRRISIMRQGLHVNWKLIEFR